MGCSLLFSVVPFLCLTASAHSSAKPAATAGAGSVAPRSWSELRDSDPLILRQDVPLGTVTLPAGLKFRFESETPLDSVPVIEIDAAAKVCDTPDAETKEVALVRPDGSATPDGHDPSVGLLLRRGCKIEIYVETEDYRSASLFF